MYKFQSLRVKTAAEKLLSGSDHPDASAVGKLIRKAGLDEIPQILNVIKGDMSLVGIRPLPTAYLNLYKSKVDETLFDTWYGCYRQNPGLTGGGQ